MLDSVKSIERTLRVHTRRLRARALTAVGRYEDAAFEFSRSVPGWFAREEIRLLYQTVRACEGPGDIAEIGSWKGRSTVTTGQALLHAGIRDCRIYAIDHHQGSDEETHRQILMSERSTLAAFRHNVRAAGVAPLVEEMVMPSSEAARALLARGTRLRLAFIDGAHDEESVRDDIRLFMPLVRPGGLVALHDCLPDGPFPGVHRAFEAELAPRAEVVARAFTLLVARLP